MQMADHWIHSKSGKAYTEAGGAQEVARVAKLAFESDRDNGIVLHFHGGLNSGPDAEKTARELGPQYVDSKTYPVFFVWRSGIIDIIRNNLGEILKDGVFRELLIKVAQWTIKRGAGAVMPADGAGRDNESVRDAFEHWLAGASTNLPVESGGVSPDAFKALPVTEDILAQEIEEKIVFDTKFVAVMTSLAIESGRLLPTPGAKGLVGALTPVDVLVDESALDQMFPVVPGTHKALFGWIGTAKFIAKVVFAVIRRYRAGSHHGAYTTLVEEVLREAYLARVGQEIWHHMKKDAQTDAFNDPQSVGDIVLSTWKQQYDAQRAAAGGAAALPRVTLVGHSTGAIFINSWIARAAVLFPELKYDVIFLAPACTVDNFTDMYRLHKANISRFRMFGMLDEYECRDKLVPFIYPRSLLYFVSGVVEGEVDVPILGMQRFINNTAQYPAERMGHARAFLEPSGQAVWSIAGGLDGLVTSSVRHGDFDNEPSTVRSIMHLVRGGY